MRFEIVRFFFVLALATSTALAGCSLSRFYKREDLKGPVAQMGGVWVGSGLSDFSSFPVGRQLLWTDLRQEGESVELRAWSIHSQGVETNVLRIISLDGKGRVQGRVMLGEGQFTVRSPEDTGKVSTIGGKAAVILEPDRQSATIAYHERSSKYFSHLQIHRASSGPAEPGANLPHPLTSGGLVCWLPLGPEGNADPGWRKVGRLARVIARLYYPPSNEVEGAKSSPYVNIIPFPVESATPLERAPFVSKAPLEDFRFPYVNLDVLREARRSDPRLAKRRGELFGEPCWWILNPVWDGGTHDLNKAFLAAEFYRDDPDTGAEPIVVATVATWSRSGRWKPMPAYFTGVEGLARVELEMRDDEVVGATVVKIAEPPLKDFLRLEEQSITRHRWQNRMLIKVKNRTVPVMVREWRTDDLRNSVDAAEEVVLELNRAAETLTTEAQSFVETGSGDPAPLRELSMYHRERIEILKPILRALKNEIANRER